MKNMKNGETLDWIVIVVAQLLWTAAANSQPATTAMGTVESASTVLVASIGAISGGGLPAISGALVREIVDPNLGDRWLLLRDQMHPARPGRLLLASVGEIRAGTLRLQERQDLSPVLVPVIRAGDRLILEEDTPVVTSRLEAVALGAAAAGSALNVRLRVGGPVVRAVAVAPGRARLASPDQVQP